MEDDEQKPRFFIITNETQAEQPKSKCRQNQKEYNRNFESHNKCINTKPIHI